jgi:hypothetical protein
MQYVTTSKLARQHRALIAISGGSLAVALLAILTTLWLTSSPSPSATLVAPATPVAHVQRAPFASTRFADEAAYLPTVAEYTSPALDENYLPVAPAPASTVRRFTSPLSPAILRHELASVAHDFLPAGTAPGEEAGFSALAGPR